MHQQPHTRSEKTKITQFELTLTHSSSQVELFSILFFKRVVLHGINNKQRTLKNLFCTSLFPNNNLIKLRIISHQISQDTFSKKISCQIFKLLATILYVYLHGITITQSLAHLHRMSFKKIHRLTCFPCLAIFPFDFSQSKIHFS